MPGILPGGAATPGHGASGFGVDSALCKLGLTAAVGENANRHIAAWSQALGASFNEKGGG